MKQTLSQKAYRARRGPHRALMAGCNPAGNIHASLICPTGGPWLHVFTASNSSPFTPVATRAWQQQVPFSPGSQPALRVPPDVMRRLRLNWTRLQSSVRQENAAHSPLIASKELKFSYMTDKWKLGMKWAMGSLNRKQCQQPLCLENTHKYKLFTNSTKGWRFSLRQKTLAAAKTICYIPLACKRGLMEERSSKGSSAESSNKNKMLICKDTPKDSP